MLPNLSHNRKTLIVQAQREKKKIPSTHSSLESIAQLLPALHQLGNLWWLMMRELLRNLIEDKTVINYKKWWMECKDAQETKLLAILCFYDIDDLPEETTAGLDKFVLDKLRVLSLLSLCELSTEVNYQEIKEKCDLKTDGEVEKLLIRAELFVDLKIDSVARRATVLEYKISRDVYSGEKGVPFHTPVRSKINILSALINWRSSLTD